MAKFNASKYDPAKDSSRGSKPTPEQGVVLVVEEGQCPCGCGQSPKSPKRTFVQGHDARLRGILTRAHLTGTSVTVITGGKAKTGTALAAAKPHAFATQVKEAAEREKERAAARDQRAAERKQKAEEAKAAKAEKAKAVKPSDLKGQRFPVKAGRWTYEGTVTKVAKGVATLEYETKNEGVKTTEIPVEELVA